MRGKKISEYKNCFDNAQAISKEITDAANNGGKLDSCKKLNDLIERNDKTEEMISNLSSPDYFEKISNMLDNSDRDRDIEKLKNSLRKIDKKQSLRRKLIKSMGIASALLLCSFLIWQNEDQDADSTITPSSHSQISMKSALILNNGEKISIDGKNQTIASNDYQIEINDNKIKYTYIGDKSKRREPVYNEICVSAGEVCSIVLDDSSTVRLNAGASIRYPISFEGDRREVELKGEGYFDVKRGDKPFIVKTERGYIKVYGTSFNVNDNVDGGCEVVLVSGKIGFSVDDNNEVTILAGQKLSYDISTKKIMVDDVIVEDYVGWTNNIFCVKDKPLERLLHDIAQWYGAKINIESDIKNTNITLVISRDTDIDKLLKYISEVISKKIVKDKKLHYTILD